MGSFEGEWASGEEIRGTLDDDPLVARPSRIPPAPTASSAVRLPTGLPCGRYPRQRSIRSRLRAIRCGETTRGTDIRTVVALRVFSFAMVVAVGAVDVSWLSRVQTVLHVLEQPYAFVTRHVLA